VILELEALPSDRPLAVRLRLLLKDLLRRQQLKCVRLSAPADAGDDNPDRQEER
jgi:hypothetical protein